MNKTVNIEVAAGETKVFKALDDSNIDYTFNLGKDSTLLFLGLSLTPTKQKLFVNLNGEGASFKGEYLVVGENGKYQFEQTISHNMPHTTSKIENFAIALNSTNVDFKTTGAIKNKMVKSDCKQLSKGIIIADDSTISSEPILLIDEFDVFASHGASIGKMSDEELFYLMSRGLTKEEALKLIISGLINPFIDQLEEDDKVKYLEIINNRIEG